MGAFFLQICLRIKKKFLFYKEMLGICIDFSRFSTISAISTTFMQCPGNVGHLRETDIDR